MLAVLKRTFFVSQSLGENLTSKSVEGTSLAFQSIDHVHGCDGLPLSVFGVGDGITDDIFQEYLEDTSGFFVDQARDTLDTSTSRQTTDGGFGDTLDVITQDFAMTLGAAFAEAFSSFSSSRHVACILILDELTS